MLPKLCTCSVFTWFPSFAGVGPQLLVPGLTTVTAKTETGHELAIAAFEPFEPAFESKFSHFKQYPTGTHAHAFSNELWFLP